MRIMSAECWLCKLLVGGGLSYNWEITNGLTNRSDLMKPIFYTNSYSICKYYSILNNHPIIL